MADPSVTGEGAGGSSPLGLPRRDLDEVVERGEADFEALRGASVLLTGGSGFLGGWLLAALLHACERLALGTRVVVLARRPERLRLVPTAALELVPGDVRQPPPLPPSDVVIHAAASSSARFGEGDGEPRAMASAIVDGTRAVLDHAARSRARFLFFSSGAVYGRQDGPVAEEAPGGPETMEPRSAYAEAKRMAETLVACAGAAGEVDPVVARLFSFVGPRLPLGAHFAAAGFLADALAGRTITVAGDGAPRRSYLYAGELALWCAALIARGSSGRAYNVGSEEVVTIAELAARIAALRDPPLEVRVVGGERPGAGDCYVPDISRARRELALSPLATLDPALARTWEWYRARG